MENRVLRRPLCIVVSLLVGIAMLFSSAFILNTDTAYAGTAAGSVGIDADNGQMKINNVGDEVRVIFTRTAPTGWGTTSWSGNLEWDTSVLEIKKIENLESGLRPVTLETLDDPNAPLKNVSPKSVSSIISGTPPLVRVQVTFTALKKEESIVRFTYRQKGDPGYVQANVGTPDNQGPYVSGPVPASEIDGLDANGSHFAKVTTSGVTPPQTKHKVTFDANGHGTAPAAQDVEEGKTMTEPTKPTASGYTFEGWYKESGCINKWNFGTDTVTEATTLYAKWEKAPVAKSYTVSFNMNGHGTAPVNQIIAEGMPATSPSKPTASGYTFGGWYTDMACTTMWNFDSDAVVKDTVLYAKWTATTMGAAGSVSATDAEATDVGELVDVFFDRTAPNGLGIYSWSGHLSWDTSTLQIVSVKQAVGSMTPVTAETLDDADAQLINISPKAVSGQIVGAPETSKIVVRFKVLKKITGNAGDVKFTYKQKGDPGYVQANVGPGIYAKGGVPISAISGMDSDGSVTAKITWEKKYAVTFHTDKGTAPATQSVKDGNYASKPIDPTVPYYALDGWETSSGKTWNFATDKVTENTDLYAVWSLTTASVHTVTFNNNGHGTAPAAQAINHGGKATKPGDLTAAGYMFEGWTVDAAGKTLWNFNNPITANMTLYAKWKAEPKQEPSTGVSNRPILLAKTTSYGKKKMKVTWTSTANAKYYIVYQARCNHNDKVSYLKKVKTIKAGAPKVYISKNLKKGKTYKFRVVGYAPKSNTDSTLIKVRSYIIHGLVGGKLGKYGNIKKVTPSKKTVTLKEGKTYKLKMKKYSAVSGKKCLNGSHALRARYLSHDNRIASVTNYGGKIKAKKGMAGKSVKIYTIGVNGVYGTTTVKIVK